ncbi:hypothetical protein J4464_02345 [Candidatus Woesearchaeota archaeon]|nr:hypothetical protein [Candidatus Woesearchaeota archaeon]
MDEENKAFRLEYTNEAYKPGLQILFEMYGCRVLASEEELKYVKTRFFDIECTEQVRSDLEVLVSAFELDIKISEPKEVKIPENPSREA